MKKLLLTAAAILATLNTYGQQAYGIVNFANNGATTAGKIWVNTTGVVGDGVAASGTSYKIALYFGNQGTPEDALVQAGAAKEFLTGANAGIFVGGSRTLQPLTANGGMATIQARAWGTMAGVPDTYEAVYAVGGYAARGPVFDIDTKDPNVPLEPSPTVGQQAGWRGFAVSPVPEPSVIGLGLLGAGALLMLRRRK
jgi:hypothetical protein